MTAKVVDAVFDHSRSKGSARLVLLAMADEAASNGELTAYSRSQSAIARKAACDKSTVKRALRALEELGEIMVLRRGDGRVPTDYRIVLPGLVDKPDDKPDEGGQSAPPPDRGGSDRTPSGGEMPSQGGHGCTPHQPVLSRSSPKTDADEVGEPPPAAAESLDESFARFWRAYPRRKGKRAAETAFGRAVKRAPGGAAEVLAGLDAALDELLDTEHQYRPHPATWLNQDRWADDHRPAPAPSPPAGPRPPTASGPRCGTCRDTGRVLPPDSDTVEPCPDCQGAA